MSQNQNQQDLWSELLEHSLAKPLNLAQLEPHFDVGKLNIQKLKPTQIALKCKNLKQRRLSTQDEAPSAWMENEHRIFLWFVVTYADFISISPLALSPQHWDIISQHFNKISYFCQYSFHCLRKLKKENWTAEQDLIINNLMNSKLNKKWTSIGFELFRITDGKSLKKPKAIRERWMNHLNPDIKKDKWTVQEELELIQKMREFGKKWSKIASLMQNRSEHSVKNHYHKLILGVKRRMEDSDKEYTEHQILNQLFKQVSRRVNSMEKPKRQKNGIEVDTNPMQQDELTHPSMQIQTTYIFHPTIIIFAGQPNIYA